MKIVNKPAGLTINQFITEYKSKNNITKLCFVGRLDPMARGEIILLFDDECKKIEQYKSFDKTYQFYIIFGIQTNSDDPLGIIENNQIHQINNNISQIQKLIEDNIKIGEFDQSFHSFSSKCINGDPLWLLTKNNKTYHKPSHPVKIYNCFIDKIKKFNYLEWKQTIINQIKSIDNNCDFNQQNIIKQWEEFDFKENLIYGLPITLKVSSGFYVRQFVRDISTNINYPLMVYDIHRISYN
jgi:tRNA pseudouridine(55) synthase